MSESRRDCFAVVLGRLGYSEALDLQMRICEAKKKGFQSDVLLLVEHPPTVTLGRNGDWRHLLTSEEELKRRGVGRFEVDRGGDITFHGPGQLVGYPILDLNPDERDVRLYMRNLEACLIRLLAAYGIEAGREEGLTGVWTKAGKIAAMGVHISRWITRHGFALNVNTDLSFYDLIVPCGIAGRGVTSMLKILSAPVDFSEVAERFVVEFGTVFGRHIIHLSKTDLLEKLRVHAESIAVA